MGAMKHKKTLDASPVLLSQLLPCKSSQTEKKYGIITGFCNLSARYHCLHFIPAPISKQPQIDLFLQKQSTFLLFLVAVISHSVEEV